MFVNNIRELAHGLSKKTTLIISLVDHVTSKILRLQHEQN